MKVFQNLEMRSLINFFSFDEFLPIFKNVHSFYFESVHFASKKRARINKLCTLFHNPLALMVLSINEKYIIVLNTIL